MHRSRDVVDQIASSSCRSIDVPDAVINTNRFQLGGMHGYPGGNVVDHIRIQCSATKAEANASGGAQNHHPYIRH